MAQLDCGGDGLAQQADSEHFHEEGKSHGKVDIAGGKEEPGYLCEQGNTDEHEDAEGEEGKMDDVVDTGDDFKRC